MTQPVTNATMTGTLRPLPLALTALVAALTGGCLGATEPGVDCGAGEAFDYGDATYCVYSAAIIIEGFDCPAAVPFQIPMEDLVVCAPSTSPPSGGWDAMGEAWHQQHQPSLDAFDTRDGGADTADTVDATDTTDTGPTTSVCTQGLEPGQCWTAAQCPSAWRCEGAAPGCTPCGDCVEPIAGARGQCRPDSDVASLGLVGWPGLGGIDGEAPVALYWIVDGLYPGLECPSFSLEVWDGVAFTAGPSESACTSFASVSDRTTIARQGPLVGNPGDSVRIRARGHYRTQCGATPETCVGDVELVSDELVLHR